METKKADYSWGEIALFALGCLVGAMAGMWAVARLTQAMAAQAPGFWFVSRAAGIVAFIALWLSTAWGISLSSKGVGGILSTPLSFALHNITSWLVLGFGAMHALALLGDSVVPFTIGGVLVPFGAAYKPLLTGPGTLALYVGILVSVSFYFKKQIGYKVWHTMHLLSYLMFVGVIVHSVLLGTDSSVPLVRAMYVVAGASVLFLTLFRVLTARGTRQAARAPMQAAPVTVRSGDR
jgi:methionine sulfoxide reductase heme-binding subunit